MINQMTHLDTPRLTRHVQALFLRKRIGVVRQFLQIRTVCLPLQQSHSHIFLLVGRLLYYVSIPANDEWLDHTRAARLQ